LQCGLVKTDFNNGWLARALKEKSSNNESKQTSALAVSRSLPLSMRGHKEVLTWYPSNLESTDEDLHDRIKQLYEYEESLSIKFEEALAIQELEKRALRKNTHKNLQQGKLSTLAASCAKFLSDPKGPDVAMLEVDGWDTHNRQVERLQKKFNELDQAINTLHKGLGNQWKNTLLIIATEFGRTVKINGTGGTDHGTGTSLFIAGGNINGGKVLGKWPGLAKEKLYKERDLKPTSDMFSWIGNAISDHWGLDEKQLNRIFPDTDFSFNR